MVARQTHYLEVEGSSPSPAPIIHKGVFMKTLEDFKKEIKKAKTKDELHKISYEAMLQDSKPIDVERLATGGKPRTLYSKVISFCIKREVELGLIKA